MDNRTLNQLYEHRSIRAFQDQPLTPDMVDAIIKAGQHSPTYTFLQGASIIGVTDPQKKAALAEICGQTYVAEAPTLFLIVADFARNKAIAEAKGCTDDSVLGSADRFMAVFYDATLMTLNMATAAEAFGLGTVFLGSVNNRMQETIDLFQLPKYTFPCLGLAVGYANQRPELKPRLPQSVVYMENTYQPLTDPLATLAEYDEVVHNYYDLRFANQRVDRFSDQILRALSPTLPAKRNKIFATLQAQGFLLSGE